MVHTRWRIEQNGTTWRVVRPNGTELSGGHASYQDAMLHMRAAFAPEDMPAMPAPAEGEADGMGERAWDADAGFCGEWTGDHRLIEPAGVYFRPFPLPLMLQTETEVGHYGAELAGWITEGEVRDGRVVRMAGEFDTSEHGDEAMRICAERGWFGVSLDMGAVTVESECVAMDDDGWCSEWRDRFVESEMIGLTMTPFPAFQNARLWLRSMGEPAALPADPAATDDRAAITPDADAEGVILLASAAATVQPPAGWFSDPGLGDLEHPLMGFNEQGCPTGVPLQVEDDPATGLRRVYGHVAAWGTCHVGYPDDCVTPPASPSQYAYFRTGYIPTAEGTNVPTGVLTIGTGHADPHLSAREAAAHYDDTGTAWAQVSAGEDEVGIWVAGWVLPGVTDDVVHLARATSPSGDWRPVGGSLEMVAALQVNVPGFPIPRALAAAANVVTMADARPRYRRVDGQVVSLVAAGIVPKRPGSADQRRIDQLEAAVAVLMRRTEPLLADAQRALVASVRGT